MQASSGENQTDPIPTSSLPSEPAATVDDGVMSDADQRWNSLVFLINNAISYLVAPVFYVGVLHAAVLSSQDYSDIMANLPETIFLCMLPLPVFISWLFPSIEHLRPMLIINYLSKAVFGAIAAILFVVAPQYLAVGIFAHAAVIGVTNGVTNMCLWELIGRSMSPARRGWTLGITYGIGPVFAVLGSCASQLILDGNFLDVIKVSPIPKPWCYVWLFGATAPAMALSALTVLLARIPRSMSQPPTPSVRELQAGLSQFFNNRWILVALGGFLLTGAGGNMIMNNLGLLVRDVLKEEPEAYTGLQLSLRFGFKSLCGFWLGWLMARYHPKAPAVATTLICMAGILWALFVPGKWYLLSFGLLGAGELYYVYYLNYIVACSPSDRIRENTAYTNVIFSLLGVMPAVYGSVSDTMGLNASLYLALALLVVGVTLVTLKLPPHPRVSADETRTSD